jgi:hypothetical protein
MLKLTKIFEQFWLIFTIASFLYACYAVYADGWERGARNFIIPVIAFFWWLFRRGMRRRMERNQQG